MLKGDPWDSEEKSGDSKNGVRRSNTYAGSGSVASAGGPGQHQRCIYGEEGKSYMAEKYLPKAIDKLLMIIDQDSTVPISLIFFQLPSPSIGPPALPRMLFRTAWARQAAPLRRHAFTPLARRSVTTDAASSHAENVPQEDDKPFTVQLSDESFETYEIDPPPYTLEVTKKELKQMYHDMVSTRRMEMAADRLYKEKKIRGFCHLSTGQEAVATGIEHAITRDDKIITAYRCHGYAYMRGGTIRSIIGELLGRREGIAYGKGGSMHMFAPNFYGGNGIVGAQVPVGAGLAFAQQYNEEPTTSIVLYGDGASNQGQVFEAFNMAKLWNLPVLFGCESKFSLTTAHVKVK
ncbi:unnamed protein product [Aspergillus oryzae]|uniref:Unnamed protein product n=1 Tax=Aspergillus oryzae TaxID=5062 RepID=A0AAN4YH84_ASPOZ|nr:unnamed protein product [Aspergillus oryzae]GMF84723.1 unnamed protein product [Aspergillus oryzae]GMG27360.1 unnamed protein product [Aspergillus oryzae]